LAVVGLLALVTVTACSRDAERPRLEGKVVYKGAPAAGQTLALYSAGGKGEFFSQKIAIQADGTFSGDISVPGMYKVTIEEPLAAQEAGKKTKGPGAVPSKYRKKETSGLNWTIEPGTNRRDFDLVD
jgi:hypothetical protein